MGAVMKPGFPDWNKGRTGAGGHAGWREVLHLGRPFLFEDWRWASVSTPSACRRATMSLARSNTRLSD